MVQQVNLANKTEYPRFTKDELKRPSYVDLYSQKPDSFEYSATTNKQNDYHTATTSAKKIGENAQISLNGQLESQGWSGKFVDKFSTLWSSKNRAHLVQSDINIYNSQVEKLVNSIKENKFNETFKEIFGIDYNIENIKVYNKKAQQYKLSATTQAIADMTSAKLSTAIKEYKKNNGELKDKSVLTINRYDQRGIEPPYYEVTKKETFFANMENALIDAVGSKEILDEALKSGGMYPDKATMETKYKAYGMLALYLLESSQIIAKKTSEGKSLANIKKEYDKAYKQAFGTQNDIQARVDDYNRSQEIGAAVMRGATRCAARTLLCFVAPEATFAKILFETAATFGTKLIVDGSDKMTADIKLDKKEAQKILRNSAISAAEKFTTKGLLSVIPGLNTTNDTLNFIINQATDIAIDTTSGLISEKLKFGKWYPKQILPRIILNAVFNNIGLDGDTAKVLLKATKGGVKQVITKTSYGDESVKQFLKGTRAVLDANYTKDKETFGELKEMADNQPDTYNEIMLLLLQQMLEEKIAKEEQEKQA